MDEAFRVIATINRDTALEEGTKKQKAIEFLRNVRWGPEKKDSFWVNDIQGRMIMDPYLPDYEGKDLREFKDQNGKQVFAEICRTCKAQKQGFIDYMWPKYDGKKPVMKRSFVRIYEPWGWIVGTGIYIDTIEAYQGPEEPLFFMPLIPEPPLDDRESPSAV